MRGIANRLAWIGAASFSLLAAGAAQAYEYPLQFAPVGDYKDLVVAGYTIVGKTVVGNCSYTRITSGSGRDPRSFYTPIPQTCTWDLYGALLSTASGAPTVPTPLGTNGTETIYASKSKHLYAGTDSALTEGGFVFDYGSHYDWLTSNAYMVLPQQPYTFTATLASNGDAPLNVKKVKASTSLTLTSVTIDSTTCSGKIPAGGTCDVTVTYDNSKLTSPTGLAYDALTIQITSNAGVTDNFVQRYTDEVALPPND